MAETPVSHVELEMAQASYERCQQQPDFMQDFYRRFLAADPAIPVLFEKTSFERQRRLLQHALGLLMSYARRPNPHLLERIAERHGPADLNIPAGFYPLFLEALVETVRALDPACTEEVEQAWRAALAPGMAFMQGFGR